MEENILSRIIDGLKYKVEKGSITYEQKKISIIEELYTLNEDLACFLSQDKKNYLSLTSLGNSIATGYSGKDMIKPLLLRNESLELVLKMNHINLETHSFARAQDNCDEHIFNWLINNTLENEINKMVHMDFGKEETSMLNPGLNEENLEKYYPMYSDNNKGLRDIIANNDLDRANIVVYNGYTGSFLDNITRKGKHFNLYGFKRDLISLEAVLKYIYLTSPNTQIYVVGVPNLLGINITQLINKNLKRLCMLYPNITYVNGVAALHLIAKSDGKIAFDPHHTELEYLNLNKNIISSINKNYFKNKMFIEFDQVLKGYSNEGQFGNHDIRRDKALVSKLVTDLVGKYYKHIEQNDMKELLSFFKERYPHDYYYTDKKTIVDTIKKEGKEL